MSYRHFVNALSFIVIASGLLVMVGWIFNIPTLKSVSSAWVPMRFITAICFVMSGLILFYINKFICGETEIATAVLPVASMIVLIFMFTFLASQIFDISTGVEELVAKDILGLDTGTTSNQPSLIAVFNFVVIAFMGLITLLKLKYFKNLTSTSGALVAALGALGVAGYIFNIPFLYFNWGKLSMPIAFNTSVAFILAGVALILLRKVEINCSNTSAQ